MDRNIYKEKIHRKCIYHKGDKLAMIVRATHERIVHSSANREEGVPLRESCVAGSLRTLFNT